MDLKLDEKVVLVTGGSKGIGEGITRALIREGAIPVIATRSTEATDRLMREFEASNHRVHAVVGDLQDEGQCQKVIVEIIEQFGYLNGIVNNAGMNDGASLEKGPAAFRASIKLNLYHYFDLVHFALPHLKQSRGSIVNISSKVALTGQGKTSGYAAAKAAQLGLTREWAADLLPHGIRVNAILPAEVMTPLYRTWLDNNFDDPAAQEAKIVEKIPLEKRMTKSSEIADMTLFLLSEVSGHTTGQFMIVDGGYVHLDRSLT